MRVEHNHAHADTRYKDIGLVDYHRLLKNIVEARKKNYSTLNVHIPFEIQHPSYYSYLKGIKAYTYIVFGEILKKAFRTKLYWENAPMLNYGRWDLARGQTDWTHIPKWIELCLDTGHHMLGSKDVDEARQRIVDILVSRGKQIKHLHIHENDLQTDKHWHSWKVITQDLMEELQRGRSFIFEKGE